MTSGVRERAQDQRALEFAEQPLADAVLPAGECVRKLPIERRAPVDFAERRAFAAGRGFAQLRRQVGDLDPLPRAPSR
jgi:hypothetical protein